MAVTSGLFYRPNGSGYEAHGEAGDRAVYAKYCGRGDHPITRMGISPCADASADGGSPQGAKETADHRVSDMVNDVNALARRVVPNPK